MKKTILMAVLVIALLGCSKQKDEPTPTPKPVPVVVITKKIVSFNMVTQGTPNVTEFNSDGVRMYINNMITFELDSGEYFFMGGNQIYWYPSGCNSTTNPCAEPYIYIDVYVDNAPSFRVLAENYIQYTYTNDHN